MSVSRPSLALVLGFGLLMTEMHSIANVIAAQDLTMRVLVLEARQLRIRADSQDLLLVRGLGSRKQRLKSLNVRSQNGRLEVAVDGPPFNWASLSKKTVLRISTRDPRGIWLGKRRYRGELRVGLGVQGLEVINYLGLEKYLVSVVGSEMPKAWPLAALKAQAVAARTYALKKMGRGGPYDVKSTEYSQVYLGVESETASTLKAVKKTRSLVLTYEGELINAVFHSSSGGFTEDSGAVWKQQLPYLVAVVDNDHHSPKYQWAKSFNQKELGEAFREIGGVRDISVLNTSSTGRVLRARVFGPKGELVLNGIQLRRRLGLKSTLVRFKMVSSKAFVPHPLLLNMKFQEKLPSLAMRRSFGLWRDWSRGGEEILDQFPSSVKAPPSLSSVSSLSSQMPTVRLIQDLPPIPSSIQSPILLAVGFGAGHGVGLSQWGANGLAKQGAGFRKILNYYYKGVAIRPY